MGDRTAGFFTGVTAGAFAIFLSFLLRVLMSGLFIPELAAQTLFSLTPGEIESQAVETLGPLAKYSAFIGATAVNLALYGIIGAFLPGLKQRLLGKTSAGWALQFSLFAYAILLAVAILLLETTEVLTQSGSVPYFALYLLPPQLVFGFFASYLNHKEAAALSFVSSSPVVSGHAIDRGRRLLIRGAAAAAVAAAILFYGVDIVFPKPNPPQPPIEPVNPPVTTTGVFADPTVTSLAASEVTTNEQFYRVDANITTPIVDEKTWTLTVKGMGENQLTLTYQELKSLPAVEQYSTLECVSNTIGGDLISTALWKGLRLRTLLEKAQVKPDATYIVFRCHDGYDVGVPLERGLRDGTILCYEMNGVTLPREHGYPLRAIVPGLYGMMNPKWIIEIEVVDKAHQGFWQRRGWSNTAEYQTHSTVVTPGNSSVKKRLRDFSSPKIVVGSKVPIAGVAFAGDRGIAKVEVSTDGGNTWLTASIKNPLSEYTWAVWAIEWTPRTSGKHKLTVRATDNTGKVQTAEFSNPFPNGATGYDMVEVNVEGQA